jgi:hypothetical protein
MTIGHLVNWLGGWAGGREEAASWNPHAGIPPLPGEDVYCPALDKGIDNSKVVKAKNPEDQRFCVRDVMMSVAGVVLLFLLFAPTVLNRQMGIEARRLEQRRSELLRRDGELDARIAGLLAPSRLWNEAVRLNFDVTGEASRQRHLNPTAVGLEAKAKKAEEAAQ